MVFIVYKWVLKNLILGVTLRLASRLRENGSTPSRFIAMETGGKRRSPRPLGSSVHFYLPTIINSSKTLTSVFLIMKSFFVL